MTLHGTKPLVLIVTIGLAMAASLESFAEGPVAAPTDWPKQILEQLKKFQSKHKSNAGREVEIIEESRLAQLATTPARTPLMIVGWANDGPVKPGDQTKFHVAVVNRSPQRVRGVATLFFGVTLGDNSAEVMQGLSARDQDWPLVSQQLFLQGNELAEVTFEYVVPNATPGDHYVNILAWELNGFPQKGRYSDFLISRVRVE